MKSLITRAAVLGASVMTAATLATPAQAAPTAETTATRSYYGAIAINSRTLAVGLMNDSSTRSGAERLALTRCKKYSNASYCKNVVWVRNGCAAVAVKYDSKGRPVRYASAYGSSKWPTIRLAQKRAKGSSATGTVKTRAWLCTTRYY